MIIENLEANLTGALIDTSNPNNSEVAKESNSDEAINAVANYSNQMEIDIEEEHKTESYQEKMNIDIESIDTIENNHNHYTKQWRAIQEVIQQQLFDETGIFQRLFSTLQE